MRTVAEIRDRLLEVLRFTVWRPSMRCGNADGTETLLLYLLDTLCFIDGREEEWRAAASTYISGCRWVRGHFEFQHQPFPHFVNEVASVYAEVAFSLGYFRSARLLAEAEMTRLASVVEGAAFRSRDWTEAELHAQFGPPTHEVVGGDTTVACYGCAVPAVKWVFFDLARRLPWEAGWLSMPLVRDFRDEYHNRMHLLPVGERWASDESASDLMRQAERGAALDGESM
jgi:hypothetical protein